MTCSDNAEQPDNDWLSAVDIFAVRRPLFVHYMYVVGYAAELVVSQIRTVLLSVE